jgi:hypothetical protein
MHYCKLSDQELNYIIGKFVQKSVPKGRLILKAGQISKQLIYTIGGGFRMYYMDSGEKEITTWLIFDDMLATDPVSFITQRPSSFSIKATRYSDIAFISFADLQQLYIDIPKFQEFGRKIAEEIAVGAINRVLSFQSETADKRYKNLITKKKNICKKPH